MNTGGAGTAPREHWLDNLRALAMLAGVVFHAALAYSPRAHAVWPTAVDGSAVVDAVVWFPHLFRMPLFFVVAGFFTAVLVRRRGAAGMLANRARRVLLPLLVLGPPLLWALGALTEHAVLSVQAPSPLLRLLRPLLDAQGHLPPMPTLAHLWFLLYLAVFSVLAWVAVTLEWRLPERIGALLSRPTVLAWGAPLLAVPALVSVPAPWPAPEFVLPQPWALLFFGLYFGFGAALAHRPALLDGLPRARWLLLAAVTAYGLFLVAWPPADAPPSWPLRCVLAVLQAAAGGWMTLACLQAGRRWLDGESRVMRWLADASYWIYLVHLPLLFAIQYHLLDTALPWPLAFVVSVGGTFALALASYALLARRGPLRWLLGTGRAPVPRGRAPVAAR